MLECRCCSVDGVSPGRCRVKYTTAAPTGDLVPGYCGGVGLGNEQSYKMNGFPEWWLLFLFGPTSNIKSYKTASTLNTLCLIYWSELWGNYSNQWVQFQTLLEDIATKVILWTSMVLSQWCQQQRSVRSQSINDDELEKFTWQQNVKVSLSSQNLNTGNIVTL